MDWTWQFKVMLAMQRIVSYNISFTVHLVAAIAIRSCLSWCQRNTSVFGSSTIRTSNQVAGSPSACYLDFEDQRAYSQSDQ
jgi:hypothetical protein